MEETAADVPESEPSRDPATSSSSKQPAAAAKIRTTRGDSVPSARASRGLEGRNAAPLSTGAQSGETAGVGGQMGPFYVATRRARLASPPRFFRSVTQKEKRTGRSRWPRDSPRPSKLRARWELEVLAEPIVFSLSFAAASSRSSRASPRAESAGSGCGKESG